ncbi:hypothetical protein SAMN04489842_1405 [Natronobacterium texcoconense]|uniref:Uncharacterized protein n=1 Tax=Natronobacterium texcoconense TaxID=1095778 RepID=A0A1H1CHB5_NATTX|nr:hypothetical protein SAMN04489842_1405 [Natronobacterium texcoconense]
MLRKWFRNWITSHRNRERRIPLLIFGIYNFEVVNRCCGFRLFTHWTTIIFDTFTDVCNDIYVSTLLVTLPLDSYSCPSSVQYSIFWFEN